MDLSPLGVRAAAGTLRATEGIVLHRSTRAPAGSRVVTPPSRYDVPASAASVADPVSE
jgi:hypothetical protein